MHFEKVLENRVTDVASLLAYKSIGKYSFNIEKFKF